MSKQLFVRILLLSLMGLFIPGQSLFARQMPKAVKGVLDLRDWDFRNDGPAKLDGEWEFYWKQFLVSNDFQNQDTLKKGFITVPGVWDKVAVGDESFSGDGFGTYRLTVLLGNTDDIYAVKPGEIFTAYKLMNGREVLFQAGRVGESKEQTIPKARAHVTAFTIKGDRLELVLQVANFHYKQGGIRHNIEFGLNSQLMAKRERSLVFNYILFGSLMIMGIYHLGLFFLRRNDSSTLFLGLFCFCFGMRIPTMDDIFIATLFPDISWNANITIIVLGYHLAVPVIITFLYKLYSEDFHLPVVRAIQIIGILFSLGVVLTTPKVFTSVESIYLVVILIGSVYTAVILVKAALKKRDGAIWIVAGFLLLVTSTTNDTIYALQLIEGHNIQNIGPFGLFLLLLAQATVLSARFSKAFRTIEVMSDELKEKNENLARLDRLKDEFLSNTSHELRTPLNGIIGIADSLIDGATGKLSEATSRNLGIIVQSGKRLANLINDILDFSKMKDRELQLQISVIDLKTLVDMVLALSRPLVGEKPITLYNRVPDSLPPVKADENRLEQILMNLVGNGVKFTHEGEIAVSAEAINGMVQISVSDTGIGIPEDQYETIFHSFEQSDGSVAREFGGTGLGLTITRQLVELHDGKMEVQSKPGEGTTFSFQLPVSHDQALSRSRKEISRVRMTNIDWSGEALQDMELPDEENDGLVKTILAVDDEVVNLQVLDNYLTSHHFKIIKASDGEQALEKVKTQKPDLVLLDVMMPRMSGFKVCQKLREEFSASQLPIIFLTAKNSNKDLIEGFSSGANDFLSKPFSKAELYSRVNTHLSLLNANRQLDEYARTLELKVDERTEELNNALTKITSQSHEQQELLHILCHDLANPFINMHALLELVSDDPSLLDELSGMMEVSVKNGIDTIGMVREMRVLEEKSKSLVLSKMNLKEMVQNSKTIMDKMLSSKEIDLVVEVDEVHEVLVEEASFVNSVLNNLISNAAKFSFPGDKIAVRSHRQNREVVLTITDRGIGMPPDLVNDLFDLSKSTSRKGTAGEEGTGFGMSLVKKFIDAYAGKIEINSTEKSETSVNHGTEVTLTLQAAQE